VTKRQVEAFSDGVFAIAITLLAIELRPLELEAGQRLAQALWQQWPSYLAAPDTAGEPTTGARSARPNECAWATESIDPVWRGPSTLSRGVSLR
jgi:hypothetical protein